MAEETDRLVLNVGGVLFETYISTLQNIPDTRLAWLTEGLDPDSTMRKEFFFDRHSGVFVHILNYYRTGKLHTPTDICGPLFEEELNFWGIDEKQMEPCCWESFTKHREAELNLKSFEGPGFEDLKSMKQRKFSSFNSQDGYTCRERMDKIWQIMDQPHSCTLSKYVSIMSCFMILLSVTVYCLNTMPELYQYAIWRNTRYGIDMFCMIWFTLEFTIRLLVCPDRKAFVQSVMNWIDFLSVIPSYLILFFIRDKWLINLVIIRLLRLFRFFKLSYGLQVLLHTLKASSYELVLLLLILLIPVVIFSSLVHTVETHLGQSDVNKFVSIPHTFWWCLITMTSVGYGDMVPETWAGKIVGGVCAICGVLIVALPISVIGSNFSLYYAHVRARLKLPCKDRKILAGNLRGLLKQPLSLSSRERDRRGLKRNNLAIRRKDIPKRDGDRVTRFALNAEPVSADEMPNRVITKELDSSEVCLDWDSTMDSDIQFNADKSNPRRSRNPSNRRQAVVSLFEGTDTEEESHSSHSDKIPPTFRGRRGGQISLDTTNLLLKMPLASEEDLNQKEDTDTDMDEQIVKEIESRKSSFLDHLTSACSSRRESGKQESSTQNTPSSRRSSMKLIELSLMPKGSSPAPSPVLPNNVYHSPTAEAEKATDQPKTKPAKKKKRNKKSPEKCVQQNYKGARRGGILPMVDCESDLNNGYSSDSSAAESYVLTVKDSPSSQNSLASIGRDLYVDDLATGSQRSLISTERCSDISLELIPRLQRLKRETQWREPVRSTRMRPTLLNAAGMTHKPLYQCNSLDYDSPKVILQQKLLRKSSRSEFDLRTKCGGLFLGRHFWHETDPIMREVSSDIDLGYIESGV